MRSYSTEGIIIKRRNFREADRILTVLTRDYGKMQIYAAGVRKITSHRSAHIELLNHTVLHLYQGKVFPVLTEAKMLDDFSAIKGNFDKVGMAYHLCELIDGLCPDNQENTNVFFLLKKILEDLSQHDEVKQMPPLYDYESIEDYTIGVFGLDMYDTPTMAVKEQSVTSETLLHYFEIALLAELGYLNKHETASKQGDTQDVIESILERKLKSRSIFTKLQ